MLQDYIKAMRMCKKTGIPLKYNTYKTSTKSNHEEIGIEPKMLHSTTNMCQPKLTKHTCNN